MRSSLSGGLLIALGLALFAIGCGSSTSASVFNEPETGERDDAASDGVTADVVSDGSIDDTAPLDDAASDTTTKSDSAIDSAGGMCSGGATGMEACGRCGNRVRVCNSDGTWSQWSGCNGETGVCTAGEKQTTACTDGGTRSRTCSAICAWGAYGVCEGVPICTSGATEEQACGTKCGKQVRVCGANGWSDWSTCGSEGVCSSGATETEACVGGGMRSRTCSSACAWGAFGNCPVVTTQPELWLATIGSTGSSAAGITVERIKISDETLVSTIALPTTPASGQNAITLTGSIETEGQLARSRDKRFVTLIGYGAAVGSATPNASGGFPRIIARMDASGAFDTSTSTTALSNTTSRAAITLDGSAYWIFGSGGTHRITHGTTGAGTAISADSTRHAQFVGDQLWVTKWTQSGPNGVFSWSPAPTAAATPFSVVDTTAGSASVALPCGMLVVSLGGFGIDRMYVADDRTQGAGGGLQIWKKSTLGGWSPAGIVAVPDGEYVRHVTGFVRSGTVFLYATTSAPTTAPSSRLVALTDDGVNMPTMRTIKIAPANRRYRGVSLGAE